ncbi:MAG: (2Fe-2S)-binding protein [Bacillota bacterium]
MQRLKEDSINGSCCPGEEVTFTFNGRELKGYAGEPIAAALLANGIRTLRQHEKSGRPRGIYCGIGHCYECRVTVDGIPGVRACLTPLRAGMEVASERTERVVSGSEN